MQIPLHRLVTAKNSQPLFFGSERYLVKRHLFDRRLFEFLPFLGVHSISTSPRKWSLSVAQLNYDLPALEVLVGIYDLARIN